MSQYIIGGFDTYSDYITFGFTGFNSVTNPEEAHSEFFHPNTLRGVASEEVELRVEVPLTSGVGSVTGRLRGPGNFSIFRRATFDRSGGKLEIFRDIDLQDKVAEFES